MLLLVGCGGGGGNETASPATDATKQGPAVEREGATAWQTIEITIDGYNGPENLGVLMAKRYGFYRDVNLGVQVLTPITPGRPVRYVAEKIIDISISREPQVVLAKQRGVPITAFGSLVSSPTAAMIWLQKSKIHRIADLKGKVIAIPGIPFQKLFLENVLIRAGLKPGQVTIENVGYEVLTDLASGQADAAFGASASIEGAALVARGLKPVIKPVATLGIPAYDEFVLIARDDWLARHPESARRFLAATARGTAAAAVHPQAAMRLLSKTAGRDPGTLRELHAEVEATAPLLAEEGRMSAARASQLMEWMVEQDLLKKPLPVSEIFTNEYF